ncbi:MAG TPA: hypothetical protein PLF30_04210 [Candidatus Moranbacteria bacterium]|jgi:hypothetical protein|nr:hypothetical protein [Candidatus Moranbacteria bacterium]HOF42441.1 hypothetical protein [Candidatus Moranbacteria bacterium]HPX94729.1 hypothetical protein [Candidatus Moranbacteria bacterium]HQB59908.1 hypothetical protein [Candidatus Moranbacteria bacterium]
MRKNKLSRRKGELRGIREQKEAIISLLNNRKNFWPEGGVNLLLESAPLAIQKAVQQSRKVRRKIRKKVVSIITKGGDSEKLYKKLVSTLGQ